VIANGCPDLHQAMLERPFRDDPVSPYGVEEFDLRYNPARPLQQIDEYIE
jgi:hypothetical protein